MQGADYRLPKARRLFAGAGIPPGLRRGGRRRRKLPRCVLIAQLRLCAAQALSWTEYGRRCYKSVRTTLAARASGQTM
jgi:hypothetical protein